MLATFVIGLREGLEAALIIGIIAAFLKQSNRQDALRKVWLGVGAAIVLCLIVGIALQVVNASLPQRQQEMLECVVAAIAVVMVSYMVLWMRKHSRDLKSDLQSATGSALARGSAGALVAMAFLAVIREGFETAVFLLAAFQSAISPVQAAIGVVLGVAVAIALGYLVYRGGVKLNLSKFFRLTGVVLVLVAAGLVMSTLRAAYEAGWLTAGQQTLLDLSAIARPGSVQESLLTGMLGIRSSLPVVEVIAYLLYAIPMLAVVLWPPKRTPSRPKLGGILVGTAAISVVLAALFAAFGPADPATVTGVQGPFQMTGEVSGTAQVALSADLTIADVNTNLGGSAIAGTSTLTASGHADLASTTGGATVSATVYGGTPISAPVDATAAGLPTSMSATEIAALNGGRLPVGVRSSPAGQAYAVSYTDTVTPVITTNTGVVLAAELRLVRTVQVTVPDRGPVSAGTALQATSAATPASVAAGFAQVAESVQQRSNHQVLSQVLPALLVIFAAVLLAFGVPKLVRRRERPAVVNGDGPGTHETVTDLANAGVRTGDQDRQQGG